MILGEILDVDPADVPPELTTIAATATATDVTERYATARELHDVLERYLDGDRDSELRRVKAEEHARAAETAFARDDAQARSDAGREIGRALGLDPANGRAMRTLMRLLTEVPAQLPPAARTQIERVWQERRTRTLRYATLLTASVALYIPFILWMGVRDWWLFGTWVALTGGAIAGQLLASRNERTLPFLLAFVCAVGELGVLTTSMGLTGFVPLAFAIVAIAWRVTVKRTLHGALILAALLTAVCTPFMLPAFGLMSPTYVVQDDALVVLPHMHHFTGAATALSLLLSVVGAVIGAVLFGRLYADEIGRAEERLTFHAWQLQQLLPPES